MTMATTPAAAAGTWLLGGDLPVTRMGYGAMQLAGKGVFGPPEDPDRARAALRKAVELGVTHIDTSDFYGPYVTNEILRDTLSPYGDELVFVTKVGARRDEQGNWLHWLDPAGLRQAVEENLEHLGLDRMDVVNLRVGETDGAAQGSIAAGFEALAGLREEGLIRHLGVSNVTAAQLDEALAIAPVACVQNMFNVWSRNDDALVDRCNEQMIAYVPYFPLGSAFQPMGSTERLDGVAAKHGVSVHQVALAWLLHRSPAILVIPGSGDPAHVEDNVAAAALRLDLDDLAALEGTAG
ncbi:MAG TPA: oxidoreductase [Mycobacteriales bacterium]|jgi:pyridoxine 4-dehydrogenase|nr:oxidoreductase [Mycobacteriales bacterium]